MNTMMEWHWRKQDFWRHHSVQKKYKLQLKFANRNTLLNLPKHHDKRYQALFFTVLRKEGLYQAQYRNLFQGRRNKNKNKSLKEWELATQSLKPALPFSPMASDPLLYILVCSVKSLVFMLSSQINKTRAQSSPSPAQQVVQREKYFNAWSVQALWHYS